jgi:branched-chain amino acid transport system ATP-binding protein
LLEVENLHVAYGPVRAVRGISLRVDEGQLVTMIGANGAGKSSSLNAISGVVKAAGGRVLFDGRDVARRPAHVIARRGLVQVPEGRRVLAPMTVLENLELGAYGRRDRAGKAADLKQVYEMFPILEARRHGASGSLSGGEQQMLAFGRALMARPKLLLLDEPSMGLSPVLVDFVFESVQRMNRSGVGILMVEQNARRALEIARYAYVLERGEIVLEGEASSLMGDGRVIEAYLGKIEIDEDEQRDGKEDGKPDGVTSGG